MATAFLGFRRDPSRAFDFSDAKRWAPEGSSFKLIAPDLEKDRMFTTARIKVLNDGNPKDKERLYISGIANANIVDRMQERLDPRGVIVQDFLKNAQLLAHHSYYHPIGQVEELDIQEDGVHFRAWIGDPSKAELTDMQKEMRSLVSQGILKTVSVGFIPKKVRAPLFDDNGVMTEPCVIESWDLLELSVVAVPCNQDSVFEIRGYPTNKEGAIVDEGKKQAVTLNETDTNAAISELAEQNMVVQSLIFSKDSFSIDEAKKWAADHGFRSDKVDETPDSIRLRQYDPEDFDAESFRTIDLTEGVQAVVGKMKDGKAEAPSDSSGSDWQGEMLTLMRGMSEMLKRNVDICETMMAKMEEKPSSDEGGETPAPAPAEGEPAEEGCKPKKEVDQRIEKLEAGFEKLVKSFECLVQKLGQ